jgi:3-methyl-2-oxobutanoate hydroxymethyltransferase
MTLHEILQKKSKKQKLSMVTCYDYTSAAIVNQSPIDLILVGDSLAMTMHGHNSTLPATTTLMALHTAAVVKGAPTKFIVADLPFLSFRSSLEKNIEAVRELMSTGAHAVKLEGAQGNLELVKHLVQSGVPVMGHLGLTPQSIHQLGGFKVQAREEKAQAQLLEDALALEKAGAFAIVLECVPSEIAAKVTASLEIPTIGIGAGPQVDGQVLVWQDLLGMNPGFKPKFLRQYLNAHELFQSALKKYHQDVQSGEFPSAEESYS